jgi:hypothetical protein
LIAGAVGIGITDPATQFATYQLAVNGWIEAKEVVVQAGWSDYVFDPNYRLMPLSEVESYLAVEHHLPGIPSAKQVAEKGVSVGEMQSKLLAQIEQLTLHIIAQEKSIREQARRLDEQTAELKTQSDRIRFLNDANVAPIPAWR